MTTIDRNKLEPGTIVRWLNNGWVIAEITERVQGERKVLYKTKPINGMTEFGGASHTTGWPVSIISADCLIDFGPDSEDKLSPANADNAHGQSQQYHLGQLQTLPDYVDQTRNMFAVWRDREEAAKTAAKGNAAPAPAPVEIRVRTRVRPGATA